MIYLSILPLLFLVLVGVLVHLIGRRHRARLSPAAPSTNPFCVERAQSAGDPAAIVQPVWLSCLLCASTVTMVGQEDYQRLVREGTPVYCECCLATVQAYHKQQKGK